MSLDHAGRERPHRRQVFHVRGIDLVERAVSLTVIGPAIVHPVARFRILESGIGHRAVVLDRTGDGDRNETCGRQPNRQEPLLEGHNATLLCFIPRILFLCACRESMTDRDHLACVAPTFPTKAAATVSGPSSGSSGSAGRRRGAGPNTTCALCRGSYSEL